MGALNKLKIFILSVTFAAMFNPSNSYSEPPRVGEPYSLLGKRLAFTNWMFVRPGDAGWFDSEGKSVYADKTLKAGPFDVNWAAQDGMPWGVKIKAYQPSEIKRWVIKGETPWEQGGDVNLGSIAEDNGVYKAWGSCKSGACYLESKDGITWDRPKLGLVEFKGSKDNNLIPSSPHGRVFIDPSSKTERYKCIFESSGVVSYDLFKEYVKKHPDRWGSRALRTIDGKPFVICLQGAVSADGFNWNILPEPIMVDHCDTDNIGYFDPRTNKYVAYVRTWTAPERDKGVPAEENRFDYWFPCSRRAVGWSETDDFRTFPLAEMIIQPGPELPPTDGIYTNCFTWIPKAQDFMLMFPAVWHLSDDTTTISLMASSNGKNWDKIPGGENMIDTGSFGQWNGGCIWSAPPLMELGDGSFALRFTAQVFPHKYPRGLQTGDPGIAIWPHGRIVGIEAAEKGEFTTVAFVPNGAKLYINARTKRTGSIKIAAQYGVRDAGIIPGHEFENSIPIIGDQPRTLVKWKGSSDLGIKSGEPVILKFKMEQAEIFWLEFE